MRFVSLCSAILVTALLAHANEPPRKENLRPFDVRIRIPKKMSPGLTSIDGCTELDDRGRVVTHLPSSFCLFHPNGFVIAGTPFEIFAMNPRWELLWKRKLRFHHDLDITPEGDLLVLSKEVRNYQGRLTAFDVVNKISPKGELLWEWRFFDHLEAAAKRLGISLTLRDRTRFPIDNQDITADKEVVCLNSVSEIPKNTLYPSVPYLRPGNLVVSDWRFKFVAIFDREKNDFVWSYFGNKEVGGQHTVRFQKDNTFLMLVNGSEVRPYTTIDKVDPVSGKVVWQYTASPKESMYCDDIGSVLTLENGNLLITDKKDGGRITEITPAKKIVWQAEINAHGRDLLRHILYRAVRFPPRFSELFLSPGSE